MTILETKNLKKFFDLGKGRTLYAVNDVSLSIEDKEIMGLVGESGSGKSTLCRMIIGLYGKTAGEILYRGEKMPQSFQAQDFQKYSREIQMIFQDAHLALDPRMTAKEIISEGPVVHKLWKSGEVEAKVSAWLARVGLSPLYLNRYPHELSGGQRQRLGIARAFAVEPRFIICDESISALDVSVRAQIVNLLLDLRAEFGLTLLFVAHDISIVRFISNRMTVMYMGSIVEIGQADDVFLSPLHPYTKLLIESTLEPSPQKEKKKNIEALQGEIPTPINIQPGCPFAARCPYAMVKCYNKTPKLRPHKPKGAKHERLVACYLY